MSTDKGGPAQRVSPDRLRHYLAAVCEAMGADPEVAAEVADHLVDADESGHASHGALRLAQYVDEMDRGDLDPAARPLLLRRDRATVLLDGQRGFGHFSTKVLCEAVAEAAQQHGVAVGTVRHSGHIGRLGRYCEALADRGLVALLMMGAAGPNVGAMSLPGTPTRFLAANPWAIGVPTDDAPLVVDISMTMLAEGKITLASARGGLLPEGCIVDARQRPSRQPADYFSGGGLLPLGGTVAPHKGFGLALSSALLGALSMVGDLEPTLAGTQRPIGSTGEAELGGVCLIAIDPEAFGGVTGYRKLVGSTLDEIRRAETAGARVMVPGTPERRSRRSHASGVVLPDQVLTEMLGNGRRFGITHALVDTAKE